MPIIELNIEKPAFKREERVEEGETEATTETSRNGGGRIKRVTTLIGATVVAAIGILTLRKYRKSQKKA